MSSGLAYGELRAISQRARYTDSFRNPRGIARPQSFSSSSSIFERCGEKRFGSWNGASRDVACTARGRINKARTSTSSRTIGKERAATLARIAVQFLSLLFAVESWAQDAQNPSAAATRGGQIYLYGTGYNGIPIETVAGEGNVKVPAAILRCVNCHARDGRGRPEGGIYPSDIRWSELSKPYALTTVSGRERPPYSDSLLIRAITMGIDSGGNRLNVAMPKYQLTREQADDLVAYLKVLDNILDPGITDQTIKIGVILPPAETFGGMHRALRETLLAAFQKVNDEGGLYGRRVLCEFNTVPEVSRAESFRKFIQQEQPFALVESFIAGDESAINSSLEENGVPLIGAISLYSGVDVPINRYAFYLLSGIPEQSEALVRFAARNQGIKAARALVVYDEQAAIQVAIDRIMKEAERVGWERPQPVNPKENRSWSQLLENGGVDTVFWLASGKDLDDFFRAAAATQVFPRVLAPSAFVGPEIYEAPKQFSGHLFLSFPMLPSDQTKEGQIQFLELARTGKFSQGNLVERLSALSAANLLIYALQRAGREVTREKMIEILEKLYRFETGQTPPLTFNPNRRVGANGAHIIGIDLERKQPLLPSTWIELEEP
jgi:ABC-type branched-subunit amino acid transport system substrate-binding protein